LDQQAKVSWIADDDHRNRAGEASFYSKLQSFWFREIEPSSANLRHRRPTKSGRTITVCVALAFEHREVQLDENIGEHKKDAAWTRLRRVIFPCGEMSFRLERQPDGVASQIVPKVVRVVREELRKARRRSAETAENISALRFVHRLIMEQMYGPHNPKCRR
jgi:hypothetical protein